MHKKILITGASSGLGACAAVECSKFGAQTCIVGRDENRLDTTFSTLEGENHVKIPCDLTDEKSIDRLVNAVDRLDGVVFFAGITKIMPAKFNDISVVRDIFNTNILSSIYLVQQLLKNKKISKRASLVFISSIAAHFAYKGNSAYSSSKGAVESYVNVLALEMASQGIRCNCIEPGIIPTKMALDDTFSTTSFQEDEKNYPLGFGDPKDIANGVIFLLSPASKWITGQVLKIDGGLTTR